MVLVSWLARTHDFDRRTFRDDGPTANLWRGDAFAECSQHIILVQEDREGGPDLNRKRSVQRYLDGHPASAKVVLRDVAVADPTDFIALRVLVERVLEDVLTTAARVEAFVSPGTGTMQAVWYFIALTQKHPLRLFQTVRPSLDPDGRPGQRRYIDLPEVRITAQLERKASATSSPSSSALRDTESLAPTYARAKAVAATDHIGVLIQGPTGAGKEDLARYIHEESHRAAAPFVRVNCAAFADNLLESRLFGYEKGAFTGADKTTKGIFEQASGGTLFLDEIGDISPYMQQSLLRVLQERTVQRIGSAKEIPVDVRVVAASHRELPARCAEGKFRWDLFYRLAVVELSLKPLADRSLAERRQFIRHAVRVSADSFERRPLKLSRPVTDFLEQYPFPGNLRELRNVVENLYVFSRDGEDVQLADLPVRLHTARTSWSLAEVERLHIRKAMRAFDGNKSRVAKELGVSRSTLDRKLGAE